jgi:hypothetical protein
MPLVRRKHNSIIRTVLLATVAVPPVPQSRLLLLKLGPTVRTYVHILEQQLPHTAGKLEGKNSIATVRYNAGSRSPLVSLQS